MSFPTQLTVLRIVLVPLFYLLFAVFEPAQVVWASVVFLVAALSDWYDGYFARAFNLTTPLGAFLDPLADKLLTSAAFIAFASRGFIPWWMVVLVILRDIYLTLFRVFSDSVSMTVKTSSFAKIKTFVQMTFIAYVLSVLLAVEGVFGSGLSIAGVQLMNRDLLYWLMSAITFLTVASALQYTYDNWGVFLALTRSIFRRSPQRL